MSDLTPAQQRVVDAMRDGADLYRYVRVRRGKRRLQWSLERGAPIGTGETIREPTIRALEAAGVIEIDHDDRVPHYLCRYRLTRQEDTRRG